MKLRSIGSSLPRRPSSTFSKAMMASAIVFLASSAAAIAEPLTLDLPGTAQRTTVTYSCRAAKDAPPAEMAVEYINLPGNTLAVLPVDGRPTLFVSIASGSGAQYVAGRTTWWTKGSGGRLYDSLTKDFRAGLTCEVKR